MRQEHGGLLDLPTLTTRGRLGNGGSSTDPYGDGGSGGFGPGTFQGGAGAPLGSPPPDGGFGGGGGGYSGGGGDGSTTYAGGGGGSYFDSTFTNTSAQVSNTGDGYVTINAAAVPEPTTLTLLGVASVAGFAFRGRRRRQVRG